MKIDDFYQIIDFAVEREKEAIQFYRELGEHSQFAPQKSLLKEFENMEEGHVRTLHKIRKAGTEGREVESIKPINSEDYLVAADPVGRLTYQDILTIAIKREEAAYRLYTVLAEDSDNPELIKVFTLLANEEAGHKELFQDLYDRDVQGDN